MKTANNCPKCGKPIICQSNTSKTFECLTFQPKEGDVLVQSGLCRELVKVAKLKKQNAKLKTRAEKSETEIEAQRLRLCRAGLVPSRHPTLAAAVDGALAIVTVLREHLADPPAEVQIAVLEKMRRQDLWQQRIERKHPAPPSEQQELECLRRVAKEELLKVEARAEKAEAELAKREKALEESLFVIGAILAVYHLQFAGEEVEREIAMAAGSEAVIQQVDMVPHLSEWLKQRGGK